jgi:hypothetical protein
MKTVFIKNFLVVKRGERSLSKSGRASFLFLCNKGNVFYIKNAEKISFSYLIKNRIFANCLSVFV